MISTIITVILILITVTALFLFLVFTVDDFETRVEIVSLWFTVMLCSGMVLLVIPVRSETEYVKPTYIDKDSTRVFVLLPGDHTFSSEDYNSVTNIDTSTVFKITHDYNYYGVQFSTTVSN